MTDGPEPRRLTRDTSNKMIAGVASGVADYFNLDPMIVRVLWALTILAGGLGVVAYVIMWIVVPEAGTQAGSGAEPAEKADESGPEQAESASDDAVSD